MRIEKLSLKGLLKFTDVVMLDFRELPPGLIAITGENGAGKTTILEAMLAAIHRGFASREGELYDYATGRDSFIEADVAMDGCGVFRSRVNIDGPKRTSDAVLMALRPDGPITLNDGKVSDFDRAVAQHFPAKSLLLASAFAAQNKTGSFIALDKKDRKALFMRLLSIERYQQMAETARQAASLVDQARGRQLAVRDELARGTTPDLIAELDRLANQIQADGGKAEADRVDLKATIADFEARLAVVQDQVAAYALATQFVRTVEADIAARRAELLRLEQERARAIGEAGGARARLTVQRTEKIAEIDGLIANNRRLIENRAGVETAIAAVDKANAALADLRPRARQVREARQAAADSARRSEEKLTAFAATRRDLARAEEDAETLKTVPFGEKCGDAKCRFLTNAIAAEAQIVPLRDALTSEADEYRQLTAFKTRVDEYATTLSSIEHDITEHETTVATQGKTAALRDKVAAADARIDELTTKHDETVAMFVTLDAENTVRETTALARIDDRNGTADAELLTLTRNLDVAEADLAASAEGNKQAVALQVQLAEARTKWDASTAVLARVDAGRQDLERRRAEMAATLRRLADVDTTITTLDADLLAWQFFAKAFGATGLPVLEIDAAGPTITMFCNQLLTSCDLARFTVELVTQRLKADGSGYVDDFAIHVIDNQSDAKERDIADLSGGEQVIVSEALRNAISIYVNTTSPIPIRTAWRDETTGALDPENAQRYMAMLRKVQELGGYHHIFFISHNPDAAALADAQIQVLDGKAAIVLPPFSVAEAA